MFIYSKPKKRTWRDDERLIKKELLPYLGSMRAGEITKWDIKKIVNGVVARGMGIQANRVFGLARQIYNFGVNEGLVESNPCWGLKKSTKARQRERVLNFDEIAGV